MEDKMKKGKSITLLSILSVLMAFLLAITFIRFEAGIYNFNSVLGAIELDYDLVGGHAYTYTLSKDNIEEVGDNIDDVIETIDNRMTMLGYPTHSVKAVKSMDEGVLDYDIIIEAKASMSERNEEEVSVLSSDVDVAMRYGELKFYGDATADTVDSKEILTDVKVIESATASAPITSGEDTMYPISINFTNEAYDELSKLIKDNSNKYYLKVKLGDTVLLDLSTESNYLSIESFNKTALNLYTASEISAKQSALQISSGGLAYKYELSRLEKVSSPLGENVPTILLIAIIVLVALIVAGLIVGYRLYGLSFGLSLIWFVLVETLMLIAIPGIKLSLGGIVGIILSTLVVCDGFVIIVKRVNEEFSKGKTLKSAIKTGYQRSLKPIISISVICGVASLAIFAFATGSLKCFAITFGVGAVLGLIINLVITRLYSSIILSLIGYNYKFPKLFEKIERKEEEI